MSTAIKVNGPYIPTDGSGNNISFYTSAESVYFDNDLDLTLQHKLDEIAANLQVSVTGTIKGDSYAGSTIEYLAVSDTNNKESIVKTLTGWQPTSPAVTKESPHLWKKITEKATTSAGTSVTLSTTYQYCGSLGTPGLDGEGQEWIFRATQEAKEAASEATIKANLTKELENDSNSSTFKNNDHYPSGWADDCPEPTKEFPLIWAASRKKKLVNGTKAWQKWSEPYIYNRRSINGVQVNNIYAAADSIDSTKWEADKSTLIASLKLDANAGTVSGFPTSTNYTWKDNTSDFENSDIVYQAAVYFDSGTCTNIDTPIRITGPQGFGSDGADIEFVYYGIDNASNLPSIKDGGLNSLAPITNTSQANGWVNNASQASFNKTSRYIYMRYRIGHYTDDTNWCWQINGIKYGVGKSAEKQVKVSNSSDTNWNTFTGTYGWSEPQVWSSWGVDGVDGDGVDYIYLLITKEEYNAFARGGLSGYYEDESCNTLWSSTTETDGYPYSEINTRVIHWTDDPTGVSAEYPYELVSIRKTKVDESTGEKGYPAWNVEIHKPKIWNNYAETASYLLSVTPTTQLMQKDGSVYKPATAEPIKVIALVNNVATACTSITVNGTEFTADGSISSPVSCQVTKKDDHWEITINNANQLKPITITGYLNSDNLGTYTCSLILKPSNGAAVNYQSWGEYTCTLGDENSAKEATFKYRSLGTPPDEIILTFSGTQSIKYKVNNVSSEVTFTFTNANSRPTVKNATLAASYSDKEFKWPFYQTVQADMYVEKKLVYSNTYYCLGTKGYYVKADENGNVSIYSSGECTSSAVQTAEGITQSVRDLSGQVSELKQTADKLNAKITNDSGDSSQVIQTAKQWALTMTKNGLEAAGINVEVEDEKFSTSSITFKAGHVYFVNSEGATTMKLDDSGNLKTTGSAYIEGNLKAATIGYDMGTCFTGNGVLQWQDYFNAAGEWDCKEPSELADGAVNYWSWGASLTTIEDGLIKSSTTDPKGKCTYKGFALLLTGNASIYEVPWSMITAYDVEQQSGGEIYSTSAAARDKKIMETLYGDTQNIEALPAQFYVLPNPTDVGDLVIDLYFPSTTTHASSFLHPYASEGLTAIQQEWQSLTAGICENVVWDSDYCTWEIDADSSGYVTNHGIPTFIIVAKPEQGEYSVDTAGTENLSSNAKNFKESSRSPQKDKDPDGSNKDTLASLLATIDASDKENEITSGGIKNMAAAVNYYTFELSSGVSRYIKLNLDELKDTFNAAGQINPNGVSEKENVTGFPHYFGLYMRFLSDGKNWNLLDSKIQKFPTGA